MSIATTYCKGCGKAMIADGLTERTSYCIDCLKERGFYGWSGKC